MHHTANLLRHTTLSVDVTLPLSETPMVDIDLALPVAPSVSHAAGAPAFQPTLSQVAAHPSQARVRWPGSARSGYGGASVWNWMHEECVGIGGRRIRAE